MYRVLVPIDESRDRAEAQADAVIRLPGANGGVAATVLHVRKNTDGDAIEEMESGAGIVERLREHGVTVETEQRIGDPADAIVSVAQEKGVDAIVLGGRKRSPIGSLLFGSVSQKVFRRVDRPVMVTGAESPAKPSHRCESCGEAYYTTADSEIATCRNCGGTNVRAA